MGNNRVRKWLTVGIILLFVGVTIAPAIAQNTEKSKSTSRGNWLYVGGSGPGNYTKIQDAVDNATDNDTVFVYDDSSPYYENIEINRVSINLIGEDKNTTVIHGGKKGNVVLIDVDNVTIAGFTIQNGIGIDKAGILINSDFNIITENNIRFNHDYGIYLYHGSSNVIMGNTIFENEEGIYLEFVSMVDIINNVIFSNQDGIIAGFSKDINITDNVIFSNNGTGANIASIENCTITGNIISNNSYGITMFRDHNLLRRNTFQNNSCAVLINDWSGTRFEENNFIGNTKNVFDTWNVRVVYVGNYWDDWIGLKFHGPICQRVPKFVCFSICLPLFVPFLKFDWHPAQEPYDI